MSNASTLDVTSRSAVAGLALAAFCGLAGCSSADAAQPSDLQVGATSVSEGERGTPPNAAGDGGTAEASLAGDAGPDAAGGMCCHAPGRFVAAGTNQVRDTSTGLIWETSMRAPAFWSDATATCSAIGMRLPSYSEWLDVMMLAKLNTAILAGNGDSTSCSGARAASVAPFDQMAMPTSVADLAGTDGFAALWTAETDPSQAGAYFTVDLNWGDGDPWIVTRGDEFPMSLSSATGNAYRCVQ